MWAFKIGWDDVAPQPLVIEWQRCTDFPLLNDLCIPRCIFMPKRRRQVQLHVYADASLQAYGAVAYVRAVYEDGTTTVNFICSKNRLAPLKNSAEGELTLPRLELTAALIAARLSVYLSKNMSVKFETINLWSDSKIVLYWIRGDLHRGKPYVRNRVKEICELTKDCFWRHCPSDDNPADLLKRGVNGRKLVDSELWFHGPHWLLLVPESWPTSNNICDSNTSTLVSISEYSAGESNYCSSDEPILDIERFSSFLRLLRVTAYVKRFIDILRRKDIFSKHLTFHEIWQAEIYWLKTTQQLLFSQEIRALENQQAISKSSMILELRPFLDEYGILCCHTRIEEAAYDSNVKFPIILSKKLYISSLIVTYTHEKMLHGGVRITLTKLRQKYWTIQARQLAKSVIKRCTICKRLKTKAGSQPFAPLPRNRLMSSRVFATTGVHFAGPLYVKNREGNATSKVYVMLFTCAVVRALQLELVPNLSTESCLLGIRRFIARRGAPTCFISDNAKTFQKTAKKLSVLQRNLATETVQNFSASTSIKWQFIVERAPWWGGFYERLVKSIKEVLWVTIGRSTLNTEILQTLLTETEAVINGRPLTYINDDPLDLAPLTPTHFLAGSISNILIKSNFSHAENLRAAWNYRSKSTATLWKRFATEYVQQLRALHHTKMIPTSTINEGDVVLVYDKTLPKVFWKLAIVEVVYPGRDHHVRACLVRFSNGARLRRHIQLLYPLEITNTNISPVPEDVEN